MYTEQNTDDHDSDEKLTLFLKYKRQKVFLKKILLQL